MSSTYAEIDLIILGHAFQRKTSAQKARVQYADFPQKYEEQFTVSVNTQKKLRSLRIPCQITVLIDSSDIIGSQIQEM